jgi:Tfp pilus assembly protein PilX
MVATMKNQKGFLLMVAIIIIVVIAAIGVILASIYTGHSNAGVNVLSSTRAFYIATSGLEAAKHDIGKLNMSCKPYSRSQKLFAGEFQVNGQMQTSNTTISAPVGVTDTTISVANATSLPSSGIAQIFTAGAGEIVAYHGTTSNQLLNVFRGLGGSAAMMHSTGDTVSQQNVCLVTSTGGVPSIASPSGKRIVQQQLMLLASSGYLAPGQSLPGGAIPAVVTPGDMNVQGSATIVNDNQNIKGCGIEAGGDFSHTGNAYSVTCGDSLSTWANNVNNPAPWTSTITSDQFYNYFFTQSPNAMISNAYDANQQGASINDIGSTGSASGYDTVVIGNGSGTVDLRGNYLTQNASNVKTIIVNGDLHIRSNTQIGSPTMPVKILVLGDVTQNGKGTVYGFIYAQNSITLSNHSFQVIGAIAAYNNISITAATVDLNSAIFNLLGPQQIVSTFSAPEVFN